MEAESSSPPADLMMILEPDHIQLGFVLRLHHERNIGKFITTSPRGLADEEDHGVAS